MIAISLIAGPGRILVAGKWVIQRTSVEASTVVIAAQNIDVGHPVDPGFAAVGGLAPRQYAPGSFQDMKPLNSRVVKINLVRGEPLLESKLAPEGNAAGLSGVITEGKRAITVKVNEVIGLAGLALPGNKVDILINTKDESDKPISKIVLEQILVLAIGQDLGRDETKPKGGQCGDAGGDSRGGGKTRPGTQHRHAISGSSQSDRQEPRYDRRDTRCRSAEAESCNGGNAGSSACLPQNSCCTQSDG